MKKSEAPAAAIPQGDPEKGPPLDPVATRGAFMLNELYDTTKTLRRERHLELLVFELLGCVEEVWDSEALHATASYERARLLYKALAHNSRPDGSKY